MWRDSSLAEGTANVVPCRLGYRLGQFASRDAAEAAAVRAAAASATARLPG